MIMSMLRIYELILELAKKDNAVPIRDFYKRKVGDYEVFINGNSVRHYDNLDIPAYTIIVQYGGWIEGVIDPFGYAFTGNEKAFIKTLEKELRKGDKHESI